jgi:hypothetical protein
MIEMKEKIEMQMKAAEREMAVYEGALQVIAQLGQQVQNALRASNMQGVSPQETAVAGKYLQPLLEYCVQSDQTVSQQSFRAQGKVQACDALLKDLPSVIAAQEDKAMVEEAAEAAAAAGDSTPAPVPEDVVF